jgi:hypothetical protein
VSGVGERHQRSHPFSLDGATMDLKKMSQVGLAMRCWSCSTRRSAVRKEPAGVAWECIISLAESRTGILCVACRHAGPSSARVALSGCSPHADDVLLPMRLLGLGLFGEDDIK